MTIRYDLAPAADQMATLADGVTEDRFDDPTPCPDWSVAALLGHVLQLTEAFTAGARKEPRRPAPEPAQLPADWRDLLHSRLDELVEAWRDPAAWDGEATVGGVTLPGTVTAAVVTDELVVHGWDLARATGQPYAAAPELVRASIGFAETVADVPEGPFGPSVPAVGGGTDLDRLLGLTGRDRQWTG